MSQKLDVHYSSLIPEEWEFRNVLSLGSFIQGTGFPEELQGLKDEQYPFFKVSDFTLDRNHKYLKDFLNSISRVTLERLGAKVIPAQSIVFAKVGAALLLNRRRITIKKSVVDNNCAAIVPAQNIELEFLYQTLLNIDFKNYVQDGAVPSINQHVLDGILVPIPKSLSEQKKIASILQSVDNAIDKTQEIIKKYTKMKQGLMQDLFNENWGFKPLSFFATLKGRIGWRGYTTSDLVKEGPLALGAGNISAENKLDLTKKVHISRGKYEESPDIMVKHNDVLIVQRGSLGKVAIVDRYIGEATINPSMILVKEIKTSSYFIYYNLCASHIQKEIADNLAQTGVPMITQEQCKNFKIYNPPDPEKEKIVTILLSIDSKIDSEKSSLEKLVKIKGGLMQDLLTGKVRVAA